MPLFVVATPIGNLQDISARALEALRTADVIACEDTRHTLKLLNHFGIKRKLVSYHEHNESERSGELVQMMTDGASIAVVSDAGTPGICDPGFRIVAAAREAGIEIVPIPGPAAFVTALVGSGIATDSVFFGGFLPSKRGERIRRLDEVKAIPATLVFYESPHRLAKSLTDCAEILGDRRACVARELTKLHEEYAVGSLNELATRFKDGTKGEIVLVIERGTESDAPKSVSLHERVSEFESEGLDQKAALKKAAKEFGLSKSEAYRRLLEMKNS